MRGLWKTLWVLVALPLAVVAAETNSPAPTNAPASGEAGSLRNQSARERLDKELRKSPELRFDSLEGVRPPMLMPQQSQQISPAQARKMREKIEEGRYWMFAENSTTNKSTADTTATADEDLEHRAFGSDVPKVLQRFFERDAARRAAATSNAAQQNANASNSDNNSVSRFIFSRGQSADLHAQPGEGGNSAISRLFQNTPAGDQPINFQPAGSPRSAPPFGNNLNSQHRLTSLSQSLEPSSAPIAPQPSALAASATRSSLSGVSALSMLAAPPSALPGLNSASYVAPAPAPAAPIQFQAVTAPKRRF